MTRNSSISPETIIEKGLPSKAFWPLICPHLQKVLQALVNNEIELYQYGNTMYLECHQCDASMDLIWDTYSSETEKVLRVVAVDPFDPNKEDLDIVTFYHPKIAVPFSQGISGWFKFNDSGPTYLDLLIQPLDLVTRTLFPEVWEGLFKFNEIQQYCHTHPEAKIYVSKCFPEGIFGKKKSLTQNRLYIVLRDTFEKALQFHPAYFPAIVDDKPEGVKRKIGVKVKMAPIMAQQIKGNAYKGIPIFLVESVNTLNLFNHSS